MTRQHQSAWPDRSQQAARHERLVSELDSLRKRGIERIDHRELGRLKIPELDRLLETRGSGEADRPAAMRALITQALSYCKNATHLATLYGEVSDFSGKTPADLYDDTARAAGWYGQKTIQRKVADLRAELATALLVLEEAGFVDGPGNIPAADEGMAPLQLELPDLVDPFLPVVSVVEIQRIYERLQATGGIFCVTGGPGMGKTVDAIALAHLLGTPERIGFLRLHRRGLYEDDLRRTLHLAGQGGAVRATAEAQALLRHALREPTNLDLLVLDDVRSVDDALALVPENPRLVVLMTSRSIIAGLAHLNGGHEPELYPVYGLGDDSVRSLLGDAVDRLPLEQGAALVSLLNGHPESTALVAAALHEVPDLDVSELNAGLLQSTAGLLDDLGELTGRAVVFGDLIARLVGQLDGHQTARDVLSTLAWATADGTASRQLVMETITRLRGAPPGGIAFEAALRRLGRLNLVHGANTGYIWMSGLTHHLVREALIAEAQPILLAFEETVRDPEGPDTDTCQFDLSVYRTVASLTQELELRYAQISGYRKPRKYRKPHVIVIGDGQGRSQILAWYYTEADTSRRAVTAFLAPSGGDTVMLAPGHTTWRPLDHDARRLLVRATGIYVDHVLRNQLDEVEDPVERERLRKQWGLKTLEEYADDFGFGRSEDNG